MNSISSDDRCALRVTAVVPSYSSTRWIDDQAALDEVLRHRRSGIRRRMLDVRPVDVPRANSRLAAIDSRVIVGVADNQAADDEHAVAVEDVDGGDRGVRRGRPSCCRLFFGLRLQERQVLVEDVLDAEEHIAETGLAHQRRQLARRARHRRGHRLDEVVDVVFRPASMIALHSSSNRGTSSVMLSSTMKMAARAAAPRRRECPR